MSKHIDVKYHYLNEQALRKRITIYHGASTDNPADGLTKPLKPAIFKRQLALLRLHPNDKTSAATVI